MTEVAGEVADGMLAHAFTTERYLREVTTPILERGLATSGRHRKDFTLSHQLLVDKLSATETWTKSRAGKQAEEGGGTQRVRCTPSYAP